jgi:hypothetical protein
MDGHRPVMDPSLIRERLELDCVEPPPPINDEKARRSKRIALNRKYKRKRRRSDGDQLP